MKKISKIFLRLGRASSSDDGRSDIGFGPPLESAPDFHQLTSKRWRGGAVNGETGAADVFRKTVPKTGTSSILADGSPGANPSCAACERIDFARLLDWQPGDARPWVSLAHTLKSGVIGDDDRNRGRNSQTESDTSSMPSRTSSEYMGPCPWCTFFQTMILTPADGDEETEGKPKDGSIRSKFTPYLRIRLAFERLGGGEKHELGRSVLFEVTTRNRSLPWGYIVKAEPTPVPEAAENGDSTLAGHGGATRDHGGENGPVVIQGRKVPPLLDPALPKSWIDFCRGNHGTGSCTIKRRTAIPGLKLIDCEDEQIVSAQDLENLLADGANQNGTSKHDGVEYVTLSYVRGSVDDSRHLETDAGGALPEELPSLIADAISVTRSLGLRYLWVDRYCIPSKRDAAKDRLLASTRKHQIELMGRIYTQSALTLVIAAGDGVQSGIPGVSVPREEQLSLKTETDLFTTTLLRPDLEVASSNWASRAWTYQEGLLSRRRLVFTPSQTYFQCRNLHCHESTSLPLQLARGLNLGRVFPLADEVFQLPKLKHHIKTFMAKSLTDDRDRLDAFRGILHDYSQRERLSVDHLLGLPLFHHDSFTNVKIVSQTDRLAIALGWMPSHAVPSSQDDFETPIVDPYYLLDTPPCPFPSWTWLSWRLQAGRDNYNSPSYTFNFNLMGDASPLIDGVTATPKMEISVGFAGGMVLSWEIDGDAIARKSEPIDFLHLKTLCFDLVVRKPADTKSTPALAEPEASILGKAAADAIEAWIRRSSVTVISATADNAPVDQEYQLTGILISGRNWKPAENGQSGGGVTATVLVCGKRNWESDGPLVRLGVLSINFEALVMAAVEADASIIKGIDSGAGDKRDLTVQLREVDIY
ncbi:hypothetical protein PT974_06837 [Cladobotryum mycophilum]|uniref:Heterokaryon incompatibility domain-containing protein n=1 Tax=Cladobotryum mycophilum TaxID=491253 RepID=A0ABR0SNC3_9HYPO